MLSPQATLPVTASFEIGLAATTNRGGGLRARGTVLLAECARQVAGGSRRKLIIERSKIIETGILSKILNFQYVSLLSNTP